MKIGWRARNFSNVLLLPAAERRADYGRGKAASGPGTDRAYAGLDMEARNSPLVLVLESRPSSSSIASTVESGLSTLRSTQMRFNSSGGQQQFVLARAGAVDIDGREDALVHQPPVEIDFHVAGAFELFEDHVVHAAAGIDQRGGDDRERAAFFDVARGGEEPPRALQGVGVDTAGKHFARRRRDGVVGAPQTRERIEQDHHVALVLHQALGLFQHHFRHLNVPLRRLVEGRADHFALHGALHVRDFFRALVDQQHDQRDFRMIGGDGIGDGLQHHGLAGARRSDDQSALALADGAEHVQHAAGEVFLGGLQANAILADRAASGCRRKSCCARLPGLRS